MLFLTRRKRAHSEIVKPCKRRLDAERVIAAYHALPLQQNGKIFNVVYDFYLRFRFLARKRYFALFKRVVKNLFFAAVNRFGYLQLFIDSAFRVIGKPFAFYKRDFDF